MSEKRCPMPGCPYEVPADWRPDAEGGYDLFLVGHLSVAHGWREVLGTLRSMREEIVGLKDDAENNAETYRRACQDIDRLRAEVQDGARLRLRY
jgi:hypothetical protein